MSRATLGMSAAAGASVSTPGAPTGLAATPGNTQVALSWSAPASTGGLPITDYLVEFSDNGGTSWSPFTDAVTSSTGATVTGLTNGTAYTFRVSAINLLGTGTASGTTGGTPTSGATAPSAPAAPSASLYDLTSVDLAVVAPSNGGSPITDYVWQFSINGGSSWSTYSDTVTAALTLIATGLTTGETYLWRVAAVNAIGQGSYSPASTGVLLAGAPSAPAAPSASVLTATSMSVTWSAPAANGSAITDYIVEFSSDGGSNWTTFADGTSTSSSATVTGLTPGLTYQFRVAASNGVGTSAYSAASTGVLLAVATAGVYQFDATVAALPEIVDTSGVLTGVRDGTGSVPSSSGILGVYHDGTSYNNVQVFIEFDTSSIPDGETITGATLEIVGGGAITTVPFTVEAYAYDYGGGSPTGADFRSSTDLATLLSGGSRVAYRDINAAGSNWSDTPQRNVLASDGTNFNAAINKTGVTRLVLVGSLARSGALAANEIAAVSYDLGATNKPRLTVTTSVAPQILAYAGVDSGGSNFSTSKVYAYDGTTWADKTPASVSASNQYVIGRTSMFTDGRVLLMRAATDTLMRAEYVGGPMSTVTVGTSAGVVSGIGVVGSTGRYVLATESGQVWTSDDAGATWTQRVASGRAFIDITWDGVRLLGLVNGGALYDSLDGGVTWNLVATTATLGGGTLTWQNVLFNGTRWIVTGYASGLARVYQSGDRTTWATATLPTTSPVVSSAVTAGVFMLVHSSGEVSISTDGITFTAATSVAVVAGFPKVTAANGRFYIANGGTAVLTSNDNGTSWTTAYTAAVAVTHVVVAERYTVPAAVTALTPTPTSTQVALAWTAPVDRGQLPITDYVVQFSADSGATWTTFADGTSATTGATVTGLTNGTTYLFRVAAVNSRGAGPWSATVSAAPSGGGSTPTVVTSLSKALNDGNAFDPTSVTFTQAELGNPIAGDLIMVATIGYSSDGENGDSSIQVSGGAGAWYAQNNGADKTIAWHYWDSGDGTYTVSVPAGEQVVATAIVVRGAAALDPFDEATDQPSTPTNSGQTTGTVTVNSNNAYATAGTNRLLVMLVWRSGTGTFSSVPGAMTVRGAQQGLAAHYTLVTEPIAASGPIGTRAFSSVNTGFAEAKAFLVKP